MNSPETVAIQRRTISTLTTVQVLGGLGTAGTVAAGSLLVSSISESETLAGLAQTFSVLGAAAMAIPLSRLTQRGGRRLGLAIGYSLGAIGALLAVIGGTEEILTMMLIGTFLVGAASASALQARFAATDLAHSSSRSKHLSIVVWGSTIGAVAGPNLMGPSGHVAKTFSLPPLVGPYLIAITSLSLAALVTFIFLRPDPYLRAIEIHSGNSEAPAKLSLRKTLARLRGEEAAKFAIATIAIGHAAMVSIMVMTPVHMAHVDVTIEVIGLVISVHVIGMYAFSPIVGWLTDRLGRITMIRVGFALFLASALISGTAYAGDITAMGVGLFLLGLGWSCTLIAGSTFLAESVEESIKPSVQGASDLTMNLTGAIGGALAGLIIGTLGYGWLCAIAMIPVLLLGYLSIHLKSKSS